MNTVLISIVYYCKKLIKLFRGYWCNDNSLIHNNIRDCSSDKRISFALIQNVPFSAKDKINSSENVK